MTQELHMLAKRPCAFSNAVKVLAALGWRLKMLTGRKPSESGIYAMQDCMLSCPTCLAVVGLWSHAPAPQTQGTRGCGGLLGAWGAGASVAKPSLQAMTIAGGMEGDHGNSAPSAWMPTSVAALGGNNRKPPAFGTAIMRAETGTVAAAPFGSSHSEAPFGAAVCLSELPRSQSRGTTASAAVMGRIALGRKRPREEVSDGRDAASKAAKIIAEMFDESLKEGVAAQLRAADLPLGSSDANALDPVLSHRAW
jgi:hypothetical protein